MHRSSQTRHDRHCVNHSTAAKFAARTHAFQNERNERSRDLVRAGEAAPLVLGWAIQRWEIPASEQMPPEVEIFEPLGDPAHYRVYTAEEYAKGHYEFCGLGDGFYVHICDITHVTPYRPLIEAPNMLRVRIASADDCEYYPAESDSELRLKGPGVTMIIEPEGQPPAQVVFDGHTIAASVYIHRSTLERLYADRHHELPAAVQAFVAGTLDRTVAQPLPLGPSMLRCLEDLRGCELAGHGRRLFVRSKAIEILCHAFSLLGQEPGSGFADASAPTRRGVLKAQEYLMENFITPPSLESLAHHVGLSRSGLSAGFRQIVGQTVFDYVAELRMRRALTLLVEQDAPITQIAYDVGYSHPSSFSLAVQRRFGSTPSELRRRGLPGI